jgi:hypothetical protein
LYRFHLRFQELRLETESSINAFRAIWVAPSIILGMGMTRLCSDAITLFRSRRNVQIDWIPLVWAVCIFIWQIQYLWAIIDLPTFVQKWTLFDFMILLALSLTLFVSAALVFPDAQMHAGAKLEENFLRDGRWSLIALSAWGLTAVLADLALFDEAFLSRDIGLMIVIATAPLIYLMTRKRSLKALITGGNLALTLWTAWVLSPKSY